MKRVVLRKKILVYALSLLLAMGSLSGLGLAQVSTPSRISGMVVDPQGAVIPNASAEGLSQSYRSLRDIPERPAFCT